MGELPWRYRPSPRRFGVLISRPRLIIFLQPNVEQDTTVGHHRAPRTVVDLTPPAARGRKFLPLNIGFVTPTRKLAASGWRGQRLTVHADIFAQSGACQGLLSSVWRSESAPLPQLVLHLSILAHGDVETSDGFFEWMVIHRIATGTSASPAG